MVDFCETSMAKMCVENLWLPLIVVALFLLHQKNKSTIIYHQSQITYFGLYLFTDHCQTVIIVSATCWNTNFLTVLPLWSCPILFLTPSQSHTPLPQVIELPPPSPTSTEGPDPTESDYTASSSSFSFTSSSSFYATSSSSSASDKVSRMATLSKKGKRVSISLFGNIWLY